MTTVAFLDSLRSPANEKHEAAVNALGAAAVQPWQVVALQKLKQYLRSEWMDCAGPLGSCFDEQRVQASTFVWHLWSESIVRERCKAHDT